MLKEQVRGYCEAGANCSQAILLAAAEEYHIFLPGEVLEVCKGISGGFGIQGMCSGIVAGVMVLGLLFEEEEGKEKRMQFLLQAQERLSALDCGKLSVGRTECITLLEDIAQLLQEVVEGDDFVLQ